MRFTYEVTVETDTPHQAAQVMIERLGYDEELVDDDGRTFDYTIVGWELQEVTL